MKSRFSKHILLMFIFMTILLYGCKTPVEPKNDTIIVNMTDSDVSGPENITVGVNETISDNVSVVVNETVALNETANNITVTNETIVDDESEYSEYRDTSLIEESIDDIESLD